MRTFTIRIHGGALHGQTLEVEGEDLPPRNLVHEGLPFGVYDTLSGPREWTAVPRTVQPGLCGWCRQEDFVPQACSCSCASDCGVERCGVIGPATWRQDAGTGTVDT